MTDEARGEHVRLRSEIGEYQLRLTNIVIWRAVAEEHAGRWLQYDVWCVCSSRTSTLWSVL